MIFHENLSNGGKLFRMEGRTDRHDGANSGESRSASNGNSLLKFRDNLSVPFQGILKEGPDLLSRNAGKELHLLAEKWHRKVQFLFATLPLLACVMKTFKLIVVVSNFTNNL
jgi:hypothetical protein